MVRSYVPLQLTVGGSRTLGRAAEVLLAGHATALKRTAVRRDASGGLNLGHGQVGWVLGIMDRPRQLRTARASPVGVYLRAPSLMARWRAACR